MIHPIKLLIQKKKQLDEKGHFRYYTVGKATITGEGRIKTEEQFCKWILDQHGSGRYKISGYQKKHKGFWCFWLGDILTHGYQRETSKNKEVEKLEIQLRKDPTLTYEERENIQEDIQLEKEIHEETRKTVRRGPICLTKTRPGQQHSYQEY